MSEPYLLHHLLEHTAKTAPNDTAVVDGDDQYDYVTLVARSRIMANELRTAGVEPGDRIGIFLPKSIDECAAIFAASLAGGVFVPINASLKPHQVRHILDDCSARALITQPTLAQTLRAELKGQDTPTAILFPEEIDNNKDVLPPSLALGEDLAAILYTSGSTGRPKGVMLSHRNLLAGTRIVRNYLGITPEDRLLSLLPFSFDYGLNQLLTTVEQGACLALLNFKLGDQIVRALDRHEITGLAGVPTIWAMLTRAAPSLARTPLPKLRYITNSGGAVPTETVRQLRSKLPGADIYLMYGLTEAFRSTYLPPDQLEQRPTSIGKAIPECEVFVRTSDGRRAKPGEKGILIHRGPTVSMGYWNRPEDTSQVLRPNPLRHPHQGCDTVCWSGDIVTADEDGYLYFVGRDDAMIKSAGYRISPTEVEEAIMSTGGFREVAVIGLPDDIVGQKPHAVAVPLDPDIDTKAKLAKVAPMLPAYMLPARIELVDALPRTPNGKVDYKRLVTERT